jgi:hypothetical protein
MSEASFTRAFRAAGIARWPYRRIQSLMSAIDRFNERIAVELDPDMRLDLCYERDLLLHEREFLCRNPETLGITSLSNQHCSSRKYIHLPVSFARLTGPATAAQLEQMQLANRTRKSLLRGTKRSAVPMPAKRARVVKKPSSRSPPSLSMSTTQTHALSSMLPPPPPPQQSHHHHHHHNSLRSSTVATTSSITTSTTFSVSLPPPPPPQNHHHHEHHQHDHEIQPPSQLLHHRRPPPPQRLQQHLKCVTFHVHEPSCFVDVSTETPSGMLLPPLVATGRPTPGIPFAWNK